MPRTSINEMTQYEQARWLSLIEAVNVISQGCMDNNKNFDEIRLEPLPIRKYIEKTCDAKAQLLQRDEDELAARINMLSKPNKVTKTAVIA